MPRSLTATVPVFLILTAAPWLALPGMAAAQVGPSDLVAKGRYVFAAAGGCGCHTLRPDGPLNAGGRKYTGPFGVVYSTNITADRETGIGAWTDQQIVDSMRRGVRPDGERLLPIMPYPIFASMAEEDMRALVAYLRTLAPVKKPNTPRQIRIPLFESVFLPAWLKVYTGPAEPPKTAPTSGLERGRYLVESVAHCGECHTPRGITMAVDRSRYLAGTEDGPEGAVVPNITPDRRTGIGRWSEDDIADFLKTGLKPNGDNVQGLMEQVIKGSPVGYKDLTDGDRLAIAAYLKTVPAIRNPIKR